MNSQRKVAGSYHKGFRDEWELQIGSLMLKSENEGRDWKKSIAGHFWDRGVEQLFTDHERMSRALKYAAMVLKLNRLPEAIEGVEAKLKGEG